MSLLGTDLLTGPDAVRLHNSAQAVGSDLEFTTDPAQWAYSVSVPIATGTASTRFGL